MLADQLKPDVIVRGALYPEPVQIIVVLPMGAGYKLVGKGVTSGRVYESILNLEQLANLNATVEPEKEPFDGDPHKFRLGVEALRLGLAYEYDPYFSLSKPQRLDAETELVRVDRKSTRLNSSHLGISYAVFCLKK